MGTPDLLSSCPIRIFATVTLSYSVVNSQLTSLPGITMRVHIWLRATAMLHHNSTSQICVLLSFSSVITTILVKPEPQYLERSGPRRLLFVVAQSNVSLRCLAFIIVSFSSGRVLTPGT